jgi:AcrR family transcriptional regulator
LSNIKSFHSFVAGLEKPDFEETRFEEIRFEETRFRETMEVKERIIIKATDLFMRYGIRSITMDEIAAQLGISKKTIYQFFTDKDDMVAAVISQEILRNEEECMDAKSHAVDAVHQVFLALESLEEMLKYTNPLVLYDLEKHHPRSFKKLKEYKYQFLYRIIFENLQWGIDEGLYRPTIQLDITTKYRIESAFLVFDEDVFPHSRFKMSEVNYELALLFLYGVANERGKKLIEKYSIERNQKLSHEQKV